jgi:hypothetical protein
VDALARQRAVKATLLGRRLTAAVVLAAAIATAHTGVAFAASGPVAHAAQFGGFSVRPATFNPKDPATRSYFKATVRPGSTFQGKVLVGNSGRSAIALRVYSVDGLTGQTSGTVYSNRHVRLHGAGRWLRPALKLVRLAPHSQRLVAFKVRVPRRTVPGDHVAGVALENAAPRRTKGHFSVIEILRVVVGVEIRVPGKASPAIALQGAWLRALPGTPVASVVIGVREPGRLLCQPQLTVALRGTRGSRVVNRKLNTILPGAAIKYPFAWPTGIRPGQYGVRVIASHCGRKATMATSLRTKVSLAADSGHAAVPAAAAPSPGTPTWLFILIGVGGIAFGGIAARAGRRKRSGPGDGDPPRLATGDSP